MRLDALKPKEILADGNYTTGAGQTPALSLLVRSPILGFKVEMIVATKGEHFVKWRRIWQIDTFLKWMFLADACLKI